MTTYVQHDVLASFVPTCRSRLRQVLEAMDGRRDVPRERVIALVESSRCAEGHELPYAPLMQGFVEVDANGLCRLGRAGLDWLDEEGRPSPMWAASVANGVSPLRRWQVEALRAWSEHGRHGVIEAVTGTGKSRVGIEATREALSEGYSVVVAVPTRDLVEQWAAALRAHHVPGVADLCESQVASFHSHRVLVGTVQSLYLDPPTRADGKVLLVADECHRYGAGQWRRLLHRSYRRRLGLTATFERNDDGIKDLLAYFGGAPVYRIGFDRAIAEGVVAHYDVKLHGVTLHPRERAEYDEAHEIVIDCRQRLLAAGFAEEPFGLFLQQVAEAAEDRQGIEDPTIVEVARRYLKAFSERIRIMSSATAKMEAVRQLAPRVTTSTGSLLFTRTVEAAEEIAAVLSEEGVRAEPLHSGLNRTQRRDRLDALRTGRLKAVAAPTVLDEGVDVPAIDLAVVLGGSKSRRQMVQRMGRVLRLKPDGRPATFIVIYARRTVEDLTQNDGQEGCLDLIIQSADSVEHLGDRDLAKPMSLCVHEGVAVERRQPASSPPGHPTDPELDEAFPDESVDEATRRTNGDLAASEEDLAGENSADGYGAAGGAGALAETAAVVRGPEPAVRHLKHVDAHALPIAGAALDHFQEAHGGYDAEAEDALREMLGDFSRLGVVTGRRGHPQVSVLRYQDLEISITDERFLDYRCRRKDGLAWPQVKGRLLQSRSSRSVDAWVDRPWPDSPARRRLDAKLAALGSLSWFVISDQAIERHRDLHTSSDDAARRDLEQLLTDVDRDHDRSVLLADGRIAMARSGYQLILDPELRTVADYDSCGQGRTYSDYLDFGRARRRAIRLRQERPEPDSPLEIENPPELLDYVDFGTIYYTYTTHQRLVPIADHGALNGWDVDRAIRHLMLVDVANADAIQVLPRGALGVQGPEVLWLFRPDGLSVAARTDAGALEELLAEVACESTSGLSNKTPASSANLDREEGPHEDMSDPELQLRTKTRPEGSQTHHQACEESLKESGGDSDESVQPKAGRPDFIAQLERLVDFKERGYLTDAEFAAAKMKLLL